MFYFDYKSNPQSFLLLNRYSFETKIYIELAVVGMALLNKALYNIAQQNSKHYIKLL